MKTQTKETLETFAIAIVLAALTMYMLGLKAEAEVYGVVGVGTTKAQLSQGSSEGGIAWQQKGFPHHEGTTDTAYSLGVGYRFPWAAVELRYHDLGSVTAYGQWGYNDDGTPIGKTYTGDGSAKVKGESLAGIVRYSFTPSISVGMEAGAFFWKSAWREKITDGCETFYHEPVKTSGIGPLVGLVVSYKSFDLRYEQFKVIPRDGNFDSIKSVSLNYRF